MKRILLTLALLFSSVAADAASVTTPTGSLVIVYTNDAGTAIYSPKASLTNVAAAQWVTWCQTHYANVAAANTPQGCFNTWADDVFNQMVQNVQSSNASLAAAAASASATGPTITPAQ